jgi:hypothetical protein
MRIDAIPVGKNPPEDVNVVVEVAIGGRAPEPMMLKAVRCAGTSNEVAQLIFKRLTNASTEATNGAPIRDGTT